jgi:hypothetical protein
LPRVGRAVRVVGPSSVERERTTVVRATPTANPGGGLALELRTLVADVRERFPRPTARKAVTHG